MSVDSPAQTHTSQDDSPVLEVPIETKLDVQQCPVKHVTVYCDRAEVERHFTFEHPEPGLHSLVITGLTESTDPDSIRVRGLASSKVIYPIDMCHPAYRMMQTLVGESTRTRGTWT